jgi:hypothetical protein
MQQTSLISSRINKMCYDLSNTGRGNAIEDTSNVTALNVLY